MAKEPKDRKPWDRLELEIIRGDNLDRMMRIQKAVDEWKDELRILERDINEGEYDEEDGSVDPIFLRLRDIYRDGINRLEPDIAFHQNEIDYIDSILPTICRQDEAVRLFVKALNDGDVKYQAINIYLEMGYVYRTDSEFEKQKFHKVITTMAYAMGEWDRTPEGLHRVPFQIYSHFEPLIEAEKANPTYEKIHSTNRRGRKTTKANRG